MPLLGWRRASHRQIATAPRRTAAPLLHPPLLPGGGGRRTRRRPPCAVASGAAAVVKEGDGKVRLGESGVAVTKLGIGAWSWGDTTYWNDSEWDGKFCGCGSAAVPRWSRKHL
ncbi:hypothetical protein C2845_PM03G32220 [Panicum miliaceum]|uniref:NADP-dependent oxidoreductase domain-containing protein n=1 Tax=Panicum miliaceum TaxID=4540 RepID=A0A3L6TA72_PANMI|nr:hypothetical protein C2845_PM03G32220 [Panicum miliaceum]